MTSLVLGAAGALVAGILFPGVGWAISAGFLAGSLIGSLVDPPKSEGPRLSDLKLQKASYGVMIPFIWGRGRIAGTIIDQTDLEEHSHKSGGKGGPQVTNYTYTASFDILLCETTSFGDDAIVGCSRIWWNNRLVWDESTGEPMPCTLYLGSEDQMPDPTFEAVHSPDPVPAYRGFAHAVFTDHDLTDGGNTIGNWEFELSTLAAEINGHIYEVAVNHAEPINWTSYLEGSGHPAITQWSGWDNTTQVRIRDRDNTNLHIYDNDPGLAWTSTDSPGTEPDDAYPANIRLDTVYAFPSRAYLYLTIGNYVYADGSTVTIRCCPSIVTFDGLSRSLISSLPTLDPATETPRCSDMFSTIASLDPSRWIGGCSMSADGRILLVFTSPTSAFAGGNVVDQWHKVVDGLKVAEGTCDPPLSLSELGMGSTWFNLSYNVSMVENNGDYMWAYYGAGDPTIGIRVYSFTGSVCSVDAVCGYGNLNESRGFLRPSIRVLRDGYAGIVAGTKLAVWARVPPGSEGVRLSTIVGQLSEMTQAAGQYDVSELTDLVNWYTVASQMTVRNAIQPLRQAFFFDGVESDDIIKFPRRERDATFSIPDDDLCAHEYGEDPGTPLKTIRKKEVDLPRTVSFTYINIDADYQVGVETSRRQVVRSESEVSVQVAVGFTPEEAAQRCETLQATEWIERETFEWYTSRKWAKLEPCDVGMVRGRVIRIQTRTEQPDGVIKWTGALADPSIYTQTASGSGVGGFVPQQPPPPAQLTTLQVLDIPYIVDPTRQNVYDAAMCGADRPAWRGASLQRSVDGGVSYSELINRLDPDIIGTTDDVLGDFLGGNVVDEVNAVNVTIGPGGGELSSTTYTGILNGTNEFLIGAEIVNARDAVLTGVSSYRLSGLLRGRRGTEWAMSTHISGERFIVLPVSELSYQTSDVGVTRLYKAVTNGSTLASATAQSVVLRGVSMTPYSPVFPSAGINAAGDWILQWIRRARVNGTWLNFTDVALDEPTEAYRVTLWTDATYGTVASTLDCTVTTTTITAAQQTAIFGAPQSELFWSVAQMGRLGPGYDTLGRAPTVATPPPTVPVLPTIPSDAVYLGELHFDGSQITSEGVTGTKVAYGLIAIPNPLPYGWWSGQQAYVSIFESGSGTYAKRMWLSRSPFDYTPVYPAYGEGNGSANIYMIFNAASAFAVTVVPGDIWYLTIKNELPDGTPSCPPGGNGNFGLRMYPPNI